MVADFSLLHDGLRAGLAENPGQLKNMVEMPRAEAPNRRYAA
jgi:hypothetical protein